MSQTELADAAAFVPMPLVDAERDGGQVVLKRPKGNRVGRFILRLFNVHPILTIRLDPLGAAVWDAIDGRRAVREILAILERDHPDEPDLAVRLGAYLSTLASNRLISLERPRATR